MPILFDFWVSSTQADSQLNQVVSVIMTYTFFPSFQYLRYYLIFFSETQLFFQFATPKKIQGDETQLFYIPHSLHLCTTSYFIPISIRKYLVFELAHIVSQSFIA
jgi:hypothetical protein